MTFGELIRSKGFTVDSLAKATSLNPRTLEQYSSGRCNLSNIRAHVLISLSKTLDVPPESLLKLD